MPRKARIRAYDLAVPDVSERAAVKALAAGTANAQQQATVVNFILHKLSIVDGQSFRPDDAGGERETSFAEGRRSVGLQLRTLILQSSEQLKQRFGE